MRVLKLSLFCLLMFFSLFSCSSCSSGKGGDEGQNNIPPVVITDYQPIALTQDAEGSFSTTEEGAITVKLNSKKAIYGVCLPQVACGHFIAEATSDKETNFGLAIVREKNGVPDYENFTSVSVCVEAGVPTARIIDRQYGKDNVLDNTNTIKDSDRDFRYSIPFTGKYFSVPFKGSTGKVRIIRNEISGFFHFYVSVGKEINGKFYENWIELAQSKDWGDINQKYFICPIVRTMNSKTTEVTYTDIRFEEFASDDLAATQEFGVQKRDFTWAGFPGKATVINFNPKHCPAAEDNREFVFWTETNYVPAWRMNNELLYCYEFAETWSGLAPGCYEPMSDRLLAYAKVDIVEDNKVRKVVKYHYALVNPDYKAPYPGGFYPEVDEYYTFYADGVGVRRIEYTQKEEGRSEFQWRYHELSELMAIAGSSTVPAEHYAKPTLSITNLSGSKYNVYPERPFEEVNREVKNWEEQIYTAHLVNAPDAFAVFSYSPNRPEVSPLPIENDLTWHDTDYQMSHWPVDKQPYLSARYGDYDKSNATWKSNISHSSLIGVEAKSGLDWNSHYQLRDNGDKYRVYLMLLGINERNKEQNIHAYTRTWLHHGNFSELDGVEYNPSVTGYSKREIVLSSRGGSNFGFKYAPMGEMKNPVFRIDDWNGKAEIDLTVNGEQLLFNQDYLCDKVDGSLIIWLNKSTSSVISVKVSSK